MAVGFVLTALGFRQYALQAEQQEVDGGAAGQRLYLSLGVGLMFIGLISFVTSVVWLRVTKRRMQAEGAGQLERPRIIVCRTLLFILSMFRETREKSLKTTTSTHRLQCC